MICFSAPGAVLYLLLKFVERGIRWLSNKMESTPNLLVLQYHPRYVSILIKCMNPILRNPQLKEIELSPKTMWKTEILRGGADPGIVRRAGQLFSV